MEITKFFRFDHYLNSPIKIELSFSQQEHLQIFPTLLAKLNMCASLWFWVREIPKKYFLLSVWRRELYGAGTLFFIIWETCGYTWNLPDCNSGHYIYFTGLCNLFFVLQDLIGRINPYFQRIAFQRNMVLIGF